MSDLREKIAREIYGQIGSFWDQHKLADTILALVRDHLTSDAAVKTVRAEAHALAPKGAEHGALRNAFAEIAERSHCAAILAALDGEGDR